MVSLTRWRRNFSSNFAFFLSPSRWKICFYYFYINFHPRMLWIGEQAGDQRFTWPRSGARVCFQVCELLMPFECFVNFSLNKLFFLCWQESWSWSCGWRVKTARWRNRLVLHTLMEQASSSVAFFLFNSRREHSPQEKCASISATSIRFPYLAIEPILTTRGLKRPLLFPFQPWFPSNYERPHKFREKNEWWGNWRRLQSNTDFVASSLINHRFIYRP